MIIMYEYMAEISLPLPFTDEFLSLVPRQRAVVNKLMNEGVIISYALSIESGKLWINLLAESEDKVDALIESFPIADFISYNTHKLTFHNSINFKIPEFSVN
ncbi:MAG: hypothetical protein UZ05_CHB002002996 [Chlorobi bacterium OLB5]|nr:MAG: hypothetical protein UZ05_CHB002002996 [Chlorobi bacterium OLB5]